MYSFIHSFIHYLLGLLKQLHFNSDNFHHSKNYFLILSQETVAHTYNPSYSGGRDQENGGSKPTLGK
jgi:hypothetical protein